MPSHLRSQVVVYLDDLLIIFQTFNGHSEHYLQLLYVYEKLT